MSLGGLVAQHLGAGHPDLVASVVLADTVPVYPEPFRENLAPAGRNREDRRHGLAVEPMVECGSPPNWPMREDAAGGQARRTFAATDPEGYARTCEVLADVDLREGIAILTVPATVVCGDDDAPAFRDAAQWLAETTGGSGAAGCPAVTPAPSRARSGSPSS